MTYIQNFAVRFLKARNLIRGGQGRRERLIFFNGVRRAIQTPSSGVLYAACTLTHIPTGNHLQQRVIVFSGNPHR